MQRKLRPEELESYMCARSALEAISAVPSFEEKFRQPPLSSCVCVCV